MTLTADDHALNGSVPDPDDPVAIVGIGCRYPTTIASAAQLWDFVAAGGNAAAPGFPSDRGWDLRTLTSGDLDVAGSTYVRGGSFVDRVGEFDPAFFGISPREALAMDPQQRILLELSWEALERAAIAPDSLAGSSTGVYFGVVAQEYGPRVFAGDPTQAGHLTTGTTPSVASGRVAYSLGFTGPAVTVDTACSSSLVAIHLASRALQSGECTLALAGGANVVCAPSIFVGFARLGALAADGMSKPFSADADGFGVSEGAAVLVLERLSDARRQGHPVLAVLRGTAVGQDGASEGLSAPSEQGQQRVIRDALADAGLTSADVDVVEAHGTGTRVGDPIEARALLATYGAGHNRDRPLLVGSLKSNIGHTQAASGVAGVVKMVEAIRHAAVPGTLHLTRPTDAVDWSSETVRVPAATSPWPARDGHPRRAAVSSFGISGTNAHVILEQAPTEPWIGDGHPAPVVPLVLSARTPAALRAQAGRLRTHLADHADVPLSDTAHTLIAGRAQFDRRAVVLAADHDEAVRALTSLENDTPDASVIVGESAASGGVCFVFPGQGSQWRGMALELIEQSPVFREALLECAEVFAEFADWSLLAVLHAEPGAPGLDRVDVVQPVLFAVMVSIARCWQALGVRPDAVIGHSQGEIAAACVAGALSLRDAAMVVIRRSQAVLAIAGTGGMASVMLGAAGVEPRLRQSGDDLGIAAVNGPSVTVVSGGNAAIEDFVRRCEADGIQVRRIPVDYASHSAHVERIDDAVRKALAGITARRADVPIISTVTGTDLDGERMDPEYWYTNLRRPVRFADAVRAAYAAGHRHFVEMSPHPVLTAGIEESRPDDQERAGVVTGSLRRDDGGLRRLLTSVATVQVAGAAVELTSLLGRRRPVDLPTYPFERTHLWLPPVNGSHGPASSDPARLEHPMLTAAVEHPEGEERQFTGHLSLATHPWLADHAVDGVVLLPGAALAELVLYAGQRAGVPAIGGLVLQEPLIIVDGQTVQVQVLLTADGSARFYSRAEVPGASWIKHAEATLQPGAADPPADADLVTWPPAGAHQLDVADSYERLASRGYHYGPAFRGLRAVWSRGGDVFAEVALPDGYEDSRFALHPALLDAALHALEYLPDARETGTGQVRLPFEWNGVHLHADGATTLRVRIRPVHADTYRLDLADTAGLPVCTVESLTLRQIGRERLLTAATGVSDSLFGLDWMPTPSADTAADHEIVPWPQVSPSGVSVLSRLDEPSDPDDDLPRQTGQAIDDVLRIAQQWLSDPRTAESTLVVLTRRAVSAGPGDEVLDLAHAPVWGLLRSAQTENPGRFVLVDVDDPRLWRRAVADAVHSGEPQVAMRRGTPYVPRITRAAGQLIAGLDQLREPAWQLRTLGEGTLDAGNLAVRPWPGADRPLLAGEVRIDVRAHGLNFRDVMIAYNLYPDTDVDLGNEGAGVVLEVAPDVDTLRPGDQVMGTFFGIGPRIIREHGYLTRFPDSWSFEEAACVPAAFLTAYYALDRLAGLTAGERVLIHAATGGVGLAAIQLARLAGAEVFATASPPKWPVLRALGLDDAHIASSRTCDFADTFSATTGGAGVDVVVDSLAGEFVDASLRLLPRGGRFIELGKTDIRDPDQVARDCPGVRYQHFDLTRVGPDDTRHALAALGVMFADGRLEPLPISVRDVRQMPDALRFLSQGRHVGKLAVTLPRPLDPTGTVLITGGTGTLGGLLAAHLVRAHGIRSILLVSRRGMDAPDAERLCERLRADGADVLVAAADVADPEALDGVLSLVPAASRLTAVVHAAGVLDDALFTELTADRVERVTRPKLDAAWNLHRATRHLDLSAFVLFSSAAGILGTPGQANYAAANTFLDALVEHRRRRGLPATSLAWGLWEQASGMTGHLDDRDLARLHATGFSALSTRAGLGLFDTALSGGQSLLILAQLDAAQGRTRGELPRILSRFERRSRRTAHSETSAADRQPGVGDLSTMSAEHRREMLTEVVRGVAAAVLGHQSATAVSEDAVFKDLGLDSLGAVEFGNRLRKAVALPIPANAVFTYPTVTALTEYLLTLLSPPEEPEPPQPGTESDAPLSRYQHDVVTAALTWPDLPIAQPSGYVRLHDATDADRLAAAVRYACARHDALRLRVDAGGDEFRQRLVATPPNVQTLDFRSAADPRAACQEWITRTTASVLRLDDPLAQLAVLVDDDTSLILYCRFHHVVADAWGINLLIGDIHARYLSEATDAGPSPSCLTAVTDDEEYRRSEDWAADREALTAAIAGRDPALFARGTGVQGHRRLRHSVHVPREVVDRVRDTGRSTFAVTAAALAAYLRRVHWDGDIVLGIPLLNRRTPEQLATVSHVTNILPLAVDVDEDATLLRLADRIAADVWDLSGRQRFALGDLRAALREAGHRADALFDVTYSYVTVPATGPDHRTALESTVLTSGYSLDTVNVVVREYEADGSLDVDVFYAADVFTGDYPIEAAIRHVVVLLEASLRDPGKPLRDLPVLDEAEDARIRAYERPAPVVPDRAGTLDRLTAATAARHPDRIAVVGSDPQGGSYELTYAMFAARIAGLAAGLRAAGVRPDEPVPILLPRGVRFVVAVHAIQASGAAYLPIDPEYPEQRVRTLLIDAGARFAIGGEAHLGLLETLGIQLISASPAAEPTPATARPGDLAYVIYTSGSTGTPKGVMIEHHSVVNRLAWMQSRYPLGADDVILHKTPATFDVSVWELTWWAHTGARVAIAPPGAERDPRELTAAIERHRVTVMHFVPSMLGPFLDHLAQDPPVAARLRTLRRVFCSGEALTPALAHRFRDLFDAAGLDVSLVNLYGPTEATVDVSYFDVPRDFDRVPIGRPIDNTALVVLDAAGRRCPIGVAGELTIAGAGVGRGYLGHPDLTARSFPTDETLPEGRRYRTGDLVRRLADGQLDYLGRLDDQVKVRGNRVTLGEIENALTQCPALAAATVVDQPDETGTRLVAYVVPAAGAAGLPRPELFRSITDFLANWLPAYMIPTTLIRLDRLPLTRSGKVDRRALPQPTAPDHDGGEPATETERQLTAIWRDVLATTDVGVNDDFFTIGGDSIRVLRMRTEAENRGLAFDVEQFYAHPTIAALAAVLSDGGVPALPEPAIEPFALVPLIDRAGLHGMADAFPASQLQLGMLYHSLQQTESSLYKDVFRYRLRMRWHAEAFREAYRGLIDRQPALRSGLDLTGRSTPLQVVFPAVREPLSIVTGDEADEAAVEAYAGRMHRLEYPLLDGHHDEPALLHGMRVFVRDDQIDLVFHFHHAVLDGWSVAQLVSELLADYLAQLHGRPSPIDPAKCPTAVLAQFAQAEVLSQQSEDTRTFWHRAIAGSRITAIEGEAAHVPGTDHDDRDRTLTLPGWIDRGLRRLVRDQRVPLKSILLTAHCLTLRAMSGDDDVTTGCVTHARPARREAESCAGLFLNTIPVRLRAGDRTWIETVRDLADAERQSYPHRRYPMSVLAREHGAAVFRTAFNFVDYHPLGELLDGGDVELLDVQVRERTDFDLLATALVHPRDNTLALRVSAGNSGITGAQCHRYGDVFAAILAAVVRDPDGPADAWTVRSGDVASEVAEVAMRTPRRTALIEDDVSWTYARLSETADTIAQHLLARNLPPNARIAVRMSRRTDTVAVILGIMRAGAAVVPIDPTYPLERVQTMLAIAQPFLTVVDSPGQPGVDVADLLTAPTDAVALPRIDPQDIAYVLFTSGSTGEPKGVAMPHRALTNLIGWQNRRESHGRDRHTLQFAPLSFDVAFQEIFSALCGAGTLHIIPEQVHDDLRAVLTTVDRAAIQRVYLPYVALQAIAEIAETTGTYPPALTVVVSSGEQLRITPEIRAWRAANPELILENQYGPTETHVVAAHLMPGGADDPALPPIGHPITETSLTLLDEKLRPVPPGVPGEIYLEGPCVAQGYERRPGLTAQRFIAGTAGNVRYRTGDIGIRMTNGDVVCLGRADGQVKVRGYRVECAEVELAVLRAGTGRAGLNEVAVLPHSLGGSDTVLRAFLIGDPHLFPLEDLRAELSRTLPAHMVPTHLQWVDALPRTPSGKRDDAALSAIPLPARPASSRTADELEHAITQVLAEFAGAQALDVDGDFFEAGGTSIGATRVAMAITRRWGAELPLQTFIAAPTARALARTVRAYRGPAGFDPVVPLRAGNDGPPLFLVHPIGGNVICYRELAAELPPGRAVYGLQAAGAQPGSGPLTSMAALAANYLDAIRRVHPDRPVHLAGWSFGGYVAVEMARQLDPGQAASLTLLDTIALSDGPRPPAAERDLILGFFRELLFYSAGAEALDAELDLPNEHDPDRLLSAVLRRATQRGILPADSSPQLVHRLYAIFRANVQATMDYRIEPIPGRLVLLRASEQLPPALAGAHRMFGSLFASPGNGWQRHAVDPVEVLDVPGDHLSMMTVPHVRTLADRLGAGLADADAHAHPPVSVSLEGSR